MTDEEMAKFLNIPISMVPNIEPEKRKVYERMADVEMEINLWTAGLGPKPVGVMVDTIESTRRRRMWR